MAHVSMEVPAALVGPVRESAQLLYQATAESLHLALRSHSAGLESLEEVHEHRARLGQLDALLTQLGWSGAPELQVRALTAPAEVLHDAVHGALIDAAERLAGASARARRGEPATASLRRTAREVIGLDRLLRGIEASDRA
jgi:hypothetical protein